MSRFLFAISCVVLLSLAGLGYWLVRPAPLTDVRARISTVEAVNAGGQNNGFARALEPRPFVFPQDHGPHPSFQTEWWYYTGNLATAEGRRFGFQLTFFRRALASQPVERSSEWGARDVYLAHFAFSDIANEQFYAFDRLGRGAAGLAGATGEPFRVWIEDWYALGEGPEGMTMRLRAQQEGVAIDLVLDGTFKPPVLQGDRGLSQKSAEPGNASFYYSLTRMPTSGTVSVGGSDYEVTGSAWMDREWSTSALGEGQVGWDWFALQLDDGRDLMYYQLRLSDGRADPYSKGVLVAPDGTATPLRSDEVQLEPLETWRSPTSGAVYPVRWRLSVPGQQLVLDVTARFPHQELPLTIVYWEGAVAVAGTSGGQEVSGVGYLEMTGYGDPSDAQNGPGTRSQ